MAMRLDAEDVLELADGDQDARRGDEARDHRVAEEIGEKAQLQQAHRQKDAARQDRQRERGHGVAGGALLGHLPTAAAVISETTATGPTASAREVPKIA
jgi:hypothetical protein